MRSGAIALVKTTAKIGADAQGLENNTMTKAATTDTERFPKRKKAFDWLKAQGHKISIGKFYGDCDKGFPPLAADGSVSKFDVAMYGRALDKTVLPAQAALDKSEDDRRKGKADADIAEMKAEAMRREQDALWLHADDAWAAVAGLVGRLRDAIRHHLYTAAPEVVLVAGGEQDRASEVFERLVVAVDTSFNEVAGESIDVEFAKKLNEE